MENAASVAEKQTVEADKFAAAERFFRLSGVVVADSGMDQAIQIAKFISERLDTAQPIPIIQPCWKPIPEVKPADDFDDSIEIISEELIPSTVEILELPTPKIIDLVNDEQVKTALSKSNVFTVRRPSGNKFFTSQNPEENADINNPKWKEQMNSLKDDNERKKFARIAFGNLETGDPARNMSYHGYLRSHLVREAGAETENISEDSEFEIATERLRVEHGKIEIIDDVDADGTCHKRKAEAEHEDAPKAKRLKTMIPINEFKEKLEIINVKYKSNYLALEEMKHYIRHWRYGMEETTSFFNYYQGTETSTDEDLVVNVEEMNKSECLEMTYSKFAEFYGKNELAECKDCSYQEGKDVRHSL